MFKNYNSKKGEEGIGGWVGRSDGVESGAGQYSVLAVEVNTLY